MNQDKLKHFHFWHIVTVSPWPFLLSMFAFSIPIGLVTHFQGYFNGLFVAFIGTIFVVFIMSFWFRDIIIESTYENFHTKRVQFNFVISFILFLFTEVMLFVAFFWAFFHSSLFSNIENNCCWPPLGVSELLIDPFEIPLLNTLLLLISGYAVTMSHWHLKVGLMTRSCFCLILAILLSILFIMFQGFEYCISEFDISDGIYGTTFFSCTGLHGLHVILGTIALTITACRIYLLHFSRAHHIGFELAAWYWHFVDVIWLLLFIIIYCWGADMVTPLIISIKAGNLMYFNC